jgi:Omp85 superfamily domain/Calcineurin-like phosphoesterase
MKKICCLISSFLFCFVQLHSQGDVRYRVILIGDAGEINATQKAIINDAISKSIPGKTIALFLGDNVYPRGVELTDDKKQASFDVLRSQFESLRKNNIPVYFIPGNHDWDKMGPYGYDKMIAANKFISDQQDSLLQIIPSGACPGPYELDVSNDLVIVAMDSEWWLFPFDKQTDKTDCACKTKRDVLGRLNDIVQRNLNKVVIFATHHPFDSYGEHGGYYSLKQHLFPLTDLNKNLYIPLPVVGSLYPFLRKTFPPAEDLKNILYQDMKKAVNDILKQNPNAFHAAGHEHTLQLIQGDVLQVVSGAGAKHTPVRKGKGSIYAADSSGYVMADILADKSIRLNYFTYTEKGINASYVYSRAFTFVAIPEIAATDIITADSMRISLNPSFDSVSSLHRSLFGENYRKIWKIETSIPVLHLSAAGLTPMERGGGMQTHSLRLEDAQNEEWVLRSIDKFPDALLPAVLNQTLAAKLLHDNVSAIFPYAPLSVPVFANALGVAHSNPRIVYISADKNLGIYSRDFANTIGLLEEREPLGNSTSTINMQEKLKEDNINSVDQKSFLTARIQDIFLGDWDRHADQWRWVDEATGKAKRYRPVPRDRDQVYYINQGLLPGIAALPWIIPKFQGFKSHIRDINTLEYNARLIDGLFTNSLSYEDWMNAANQAVTALSDSVIETALQKMPSAVYDYSHKKLTEQLKSRRQELLRVMPVFYRFLNKNIDITASDKNEQVRISDTLNGKLSVNIFKLNKKKEADKLLYNRVFDPAVTKELRLYLYDGEDNISVVNNSSPIKLRFVGDGNAIKQYQFTGSSKYLRKIHVYQPDSTTVFNGSTGAVHLHLKQDADNTSLQLTNRYNNTIPLFSATYNADDGVLIGAGVKWIKQGFRKLPYASMQQFLFSHSFSTDAFRFAYKGEWIHVIDKTDFTLHVNVSAPDNTQNFFGLGNASEFDKTGNYKRYYRARFNFYEASPAFRWRKAKASSLSIGPSFQYYHLVEDENIGRFINNTSLLHSYDSSTIANDKAHGGIIAAYLHDSRNNVLLPTFGSYINFTLKSYAGLNSYSKAYSQLSGQIAVYKSIDRKSNFIIANRIGGGVTAGKAAFYQSLFLGGQDNLLGYRQYRFAGEYVLYNNFELRIKLANLASYVLPGQLGLTGFYDIGKVWQKGYNDAAWHSGTGGGFYFAPAQLLVVQLLVGYSTEGLYPYITAGFRF